MKNSDSAKKICIPSLNVMPDEKDFPASGSPKHVDEESIAYDRKSSMVLASTCPDQGHVTLGRNPDIKESFFDQKHRGSQVYIEKKDSKVGPQIKLEKQDSKFDAKSSSSIPTGSAQLCQEMKPIVPSMVMFTSLYAQFSSYIIPAFCLMLMSFSVSSGVTILS